jgi:hypothetical protein
MTTISQPVTDTKLLVLSRPNLSNAFRIHNSLWYIASAQAAAVATCTNLGSRYLARCGHWFHPHWIGNQSLECAHDVSVLDEPKVAPSVKIDVLANESDRTIAVHYLHTTCVITLGRCEAVIASTRICYAPQSPAHGRFTCGTNFSAGVIAEDTSPADQYLGIG